MRFFLFGTSGCHLCEQAEGIIEACLAGGERNIVIESIDIAEQQEWHHPYALRIPVLYHPETGRELAWPFDEITVIKFMASF
ncbi:MAG: glutaredoxin family protein [Gammaproteobacteria bacterium]